MRAAWRLFILFTRLLRWMGALRPMRILFTRVLADLVVWQLWWFVVVGKPKGISWPDGPGLLPLCRGALSTRGPRCIKVKPRKGAFDAQRP